jgi:hypothetical protein
VQKAIRNEGPGKLSQIIIWHDKADPYADNFTKVALATVVLKIMDHLPYSAELYPGDFHLFGPMKVNLGGQIFQTDDETKHSVLNWLRSQNKSFHATSISNVPG